MGKIFELIADRALTTDEFSDVCDICSRSGVPCYPCRAMVVKADGTADMSHMVDAVCEQCFKAGRIAHYGDFDLNLMIDEFAADAESAKRLMRQTPRCQKFVQSAEWPLCCGRLTEYTGQPTLPEARELDRAGVFWSGGAATSPCSVANLVESREAELDGILSMYRCHGCDKRYWIFQES